MPEMTYSDDKNRIALCVLSTLIGLTSLVELTLLAADYGLVGTTRWRALAYQYGAFWAGLLLSLIHI